MLKVLVVSYRTFATAAMLCQAVGQRAQCPVPHTQTVQRDGRQYGPGFVWHLPVAITSC